MGKKCGPAIDKFEQWWFGENGGSAQNWKGDYWKVLKHLDRAEPLTAAGLKRWIQNFAPEKDSKKRRRACMVIRMMARHGAGLGLDIGKLEGNYQSNGPGPRTVPSDKRIVQTWQELEHNPGWQWVYGAIATYGLRPHEGLLLDLDGLRKGNARVRVTGGKTGPRYSWPDHPEWFHDFSLTLPKPPPVDLNRSHVLLGQSVTRYLSSKRLGHSPMDCRHAYAIRMMSEYDVKTSFAARWMGHSVEVHLRVYQHWISAIQEQREFNRSLGRSEANAPRPSWL